MNSPFAPDEETKIEAAIRRELARRERTGDWAPLWASEKALGRDLRKDREADWLIARITAIEKEAAP